MLKVLLIGDSIRISYQDKVRELLEGRANVLAPEENCKFAAYTLFNLSNWAPDADYDVIHWNNGQWDTCHMPDGKVHTTLDAYVTFGQRIAEILLPRTRRLVFALTTPVRPDQFERATINGRKSEDIAAYNAAVAAALAALGVTINDLHAPMANDTARFISDDGVHLSPAGIDLCARRVAGVIAPTD